MPDENHAFESLPAYALGCLDEAEARLVAAHLAGCTICRAELSSFQAVVDQLALAAPSAVPPPDLERRLINQIRSLPSTRPARSPISRRPMLQRLAPVWGIVGLLLILALAVTSLLLWQRVNRLEVLTGPQGMRAIALHSTTVAPQASGFVIISAN